MLLYIRQIILWPVDSEKDPRRLRLRSDRVNIITGRSRTGKSAISGIIDYCLGASKCAIPVDYPRDKVSWYSLIVVTQEGLIRVSRANPGDTDGSSVYEVIHGRRAFSRKSPKANTTQEAFKLHMDALAGLSNVEIENTVSDKHGVARASFRDMAAFNFLPQHIVANPYTLFFKADTSEHREKLRAIFPLVLGAIDNEYLVNKQRLANIKREGQQLRTGVDTRKKAINAWRAEAFGLHSRAKELGLLPQASRPETVVECLDDLASIPQSVRLRALSATTGLTAEAVDRLEKLRLDEEALDRSISDMKRSLRGARKLKSSTGSFGDALVRHSGRLRNVSWFKKRVAEASECPLCGSQHEAALIQLFKLQGPMEEVERLIATTGHAPALLDKEILELETRLREAERALLGVRRERLEFEPSSASEGGGQTLEDVYRFVGRLEQALDGVQTLEGGDGLEQRLEDMRKLYSEVEAQLDEKSRKRLEIEAHQAVSNLISSYAGAFQAEGACDAPEIDHRELNIKFTRHHDKRKDWLWEIGSGANWMAYHISAFLAVHEYLLVNRSSSPVPTFLVIDQPSQVYFPSGTYGLSKDDARLRDDDLQKTRQIFNVLDLALKRTKGHLQLIVTEHADHLTWGGLESIREVANWHDDDVDYLIPRAWM